MLGEFITRGLVLVLGYAYPAFECFKTIEKKRVEIEELRFWCQYWIIVAVLTVLEKIGDIFVSWLPMYGEAKLALFIYLWYPRTRGSGYIYDTLLRPYVSRHETDIDQNLREWRSKIWDLAIYYWQNCTELGQTKFFELIQYMTSPSRRMRGQPSSERNKRQSPETEAAPSPSAPPISPSTFFRRNQTPEQRRPPGSPSTYRPASNAHSVQVHLNHQTHTLTEEDDFIPEPHSEPRHRFRRSRGGS